eukprot:TRINITY_DN16916_c0_g1_i2.p1 TRINITY_DN16916_c0_g1~~TRINITY_DN16916_c0_g1_i2.p1  ORF type:complete len:190 (+),score=28.31 TRINITY_DN16916_c0_g1_i2:35-571(+)
MTKKCILERALKEGDWARLKPAIKYHYDLTEEGCMVYCKGIIHEVRHNIIVRPLLWLFRPLNALVPFNGKDVGCSVTHSATENSLVYKRVFDRPGGKGRVLFDSYLRIHNGELVEFITGGLGMRLNPQVTPTGSLRLESLGYVLYLGVFSIYIPSFLVPFGHAVITEDGCKSRSVWEC